MKRSTVILLLLLFITGLIIVLLPDNNHRLFSFSKAHGPSLVDAVGLVILLCPYFYTLYVAWKKRAAISAIRETGTFKFGLIFFGIGLGLVIASVFNGFNNWWMIGAGVMLVLQLFLFYLILK